MSAPLSNSHAIGLVARREFVTQVQKKSFVISNAIVLAAIPAVVAFRAAPQASPPAERVLVGAGPLAHRLLDLDGSPQRSAHPLPGRPASLLRAVLPGPALPQSIGRRHPQHPPPLQERGGAAGVCPGACTARGRPGTSTVSPSAKVETSWTGIVLVPPRRASEITVR